MERVDAGETRRMGLGRLRYRRQCRVRIPARVASPEEARGSFWTKWHGSERSDDAGEFRLLADRLKSPRRASSFSCTVLSG